MNKHIIITTAHINEDECQNKIGYSYEKRVNDYIDSFKYALKLKDQVNSINIIETISNEKITYLEDSNIPVFYSKMGNFFKNKGLNEIVHIKNFLDQNLNIKNNDYIIKVSGRYKLLNLDIFKYINENIKIAAKNDADIYFSGLGVHTFYFILTKSTFYEFYNYINLDFKNNEYKKDICIEWDLKDFMNKNENLSLIISPEKKIGIITCLFSKETGIWTKKYC